MAENKEYIHKNPKLPNSVLRNVQRFREKKEETPPQKPNVVTVPAPEVVSPPPLAAENKEHGKFSHPAIRWSLLALGGAVIFRWAWNKWKHHEDDKDKK